jgi:hypothetical protein
MPSNCFMALRWHSLGELKRPYETLQAYTATATLNCVFRSYAVSNDRTVRSINREGHLRKWSWATLGFNPCAFRSYTVSNVRIVRLIHREGHGRKWYWTTLGFNLSTCLDKIRKTITSSRISGLWVYVRRSQNSGASCPWRSQRKVWYPIQKKLSKIHNLHLYSW